MTTFPISLKAKAPHLKSQGIKTKLVPFILSSIQWDGKGRWIEPFLGSGSVLLNVKPDQALVANTNKLGREKLSAAGIGFLKFEIGGTY